MRITNVLTYIQRSFNFDAPNKAATEGRRPAPVASARLCRLRTPSVSRCAWAPGLCGGPDVPAVGSAPPGGVNGGASSPATPSTPTHDDNNHNLLSALLWTSATSLSSSSESLNSERSMPPRYTRDQEQTVSKILEFKERRPVKIEFKIHLTENTVIRWEAVVQGNTIYLRMPGVLQGGSKESFMLMLDFAEERLGCQNCIICVLKSRPDCATLLRTFMFLGFQTLAPHSYLMPQSLNNPDYIFLHYNMK
ncbi:hypothetical protein O3G_MSEX004888 [Manduca sexta]|uniref:Ornithine decarboxylase antizyme n=1 Tax=Manduca sexta TaxID=7130 RepID=A0A922CHN5_MANSE|nr:hypothetical protein O3G_MSEX004888 [Manduca sexta]